MSTYSYKDSQIVDEVFFKKSEGGHIRAYLHAAAGADPRALQDIINTSGKEGWQVTPYNLGGKPVLEVHGFKSEPQFRQFLEDKGWAQGSSTYIKSKEDKLGFKEQLKKRSLGASGLFYLVGDAAFMKYGYSGDDPWNTAGGVMYGIGTTSLLLGGRKDQSDLQVREIAKKLDDYLKVNGADLPKECALDSIVHDHKKGLIKSGDEILRRYPSELMNLFYAAAGACIAKSAYGHMNSSVDNQHYAEVIARKEAKSGKLTKAQETEIKSKVDYFHKLEGKLDIGLGSMTGASGLFAMSVKEKKPDPDAPKKHGMGAVWEWIQEKPLAVAGMGYMVSTACHAVSTKVAWDYASEARRKTVPWRALFVGANVIAEILLAISSKGHGEGVKSDKSVDGTIISVAADAIVNQPARMQPILIDHVAKFLGRKDVLAIKDEEAKALLMQQVEVMRKNPWALAPHPVKAAEEKPVTVVLHADKAAKPAAWVAKAAESKAEAATAQSSVSH